MSKNAPEQDAETVDYKGFTPPPSTAQRTSNWVFVIIAALASVFLACPLGIGVGFLIGRGTVTTDGKGAGPVPQANKADKNPGVAPDAWTYSSLQDHLDSKGLKTSRGSGKLGERKGMWFARHEKGERIVLQDEMEKFVNHFDKKTRDSVFFFVEICVSATDAKKQAEIIGDVNQKQAITSRNAVIVASPEKLAELAKLLP